MEEYSAKHWAAKSEKSAVKASESASKAEQYAQAGGLYGKITNCITEIPQDIKLELADGALTLKAGSKVYIPNGFEADGVTPKFDVVVIESDITYSYSGSATGASFICLNPDGKSLGVSRVSYTVSGTSVTNGYVIYRTDLNKIHYYDANGEVQDTRSLPIAIVQRSPSFSSIDQIFNGFGYVGSTVFALPGVKGLIPDGRNADGTLKNIEFTVDSVWLGQTSYNTNKATLGVVPNMKLLVYVTDNDVVYDESCNENKLVSNGNYWDGCFAGSVSVSDMKFTSVQPKTTFHAVDYQEAALKQNFQVVSTLPSSPQPDVFYFIPE